MSYTFNNFTHNIWDSIERFSYPVWVVKSIPDIKCTCIDHSTKQASKSCKKCLGLGTRIKIYKTQAVLREGKEQEAVFSDTTLSSTPKVTYFKYTDTVIHPDDYVIDKEDIYTVFTKQYLRGEDGEPNTIKCLCPPIKMHSKTILANFKEVLKQYGHTL